MLTASPDPASNGKAYYFMTDHSTDAEPGRYSVTGSQARLESGMKALLESWQERKRGGDSLAGTSRTINVHDTATLTAVPNGQIEFGIRDDQPELVIPAAILELGDKVEEGQLIRAVALSWFEILRALERDPTFLYQLHWHKFEEVIAGAYKQDGWRDVILTPRSGDGGRDIIVSKPGFGAIKFIDQVKAYKPGHRVTAEEVRAIMGVLSRDPNVSKAIVTTTATFAPGIEKEWHNFMPFRLELRDGVTTREWLRSLM
jgi:restriction system protein